MLALLKKYDDRENGFTLIELLIVVLIIGILAAVAIPVYLGIQNQAHKSAVKADVNSRVKQVQVALTEGATLASLDTSAAPATGSDREKLYTIVAGDGKSFKVVGSADTTKGSSINYAYTYDSTTGNFSEADTPFSLGGYDSASNTYTVTGDTFTSFSQVANNHTDYYYYDLDLATNTVLINTGGGWTPTLVANGAWSYLNGATGTQSLPLAAKSDVKVYYANGTQATAAINANTSDMPRLSVYYGGAGVGKFSLRTDLSFSVGFNSQAEFNNFMNGGYAIATYQGKTYRFNLS